MQIDISTESAEFLQSQVAAGCFRSQGAALEAAIGLLKKNVDIRSHVLEGCEQLDRGDYVEFDNESLKNFFNSLFGDVTSASAG